MMKRLAYVTLFCLFSLPAKAQNSVSYLEEMEALGYVAGQGLACGASKYDTFEMLARAILVTKATSDAMQERGMVTYNDKKASAYFSKRMDGLYECGDINRRFDSQGIFDIKLYADGTIQMPDGKVFTPRTPYDATLVYDKSKNMRKEAENIYNKSGNQKVEVKIESSSPVASSGGTSSSKPLELVAQNRGSSTQGQAQSAKPQAPLESSVKRISRSPR